MPNPQSAPPSSTAQSSVTQPPAPPKSLLVRLVATLPGLALLFGIGLAGKWIEAAIKQYGAEHHMTLPNIEYVLWAILIGVVIGNTLGLVRWFRIFAPGIETYEFWLKLG